MILLNSDILKCTDFLLNLGLSQVKAVHLEKHTDLSSPLTGKLTIFINKYMKYIHSSQKPARQVAHVSGFIPLPWLCLQTMMSTQAALWTWTPLKLPADLWKSILFLFQPFLPFKERAKSCWNWKSSASLSYCWIFVPLHQFRLLQ